MRGRIIHGLLILVVSIIGCLVYAVILRNPPQSLLASQLVVSDAFMVRSDGPRFDARPAREDIVLLLFDFDSASKLGYVHSYPDDLEVYRKLNDAGARVIFDTRMIAAAEPEAYKDVEGLLDGMSTIRSDGKLMRDIWLSAAFQQTSANKYSLLMVQQVLNAHPNAVPSIESRLYPLAYFDSRGVNESAPLVIAREVWGLPRGEKSVVGEQLRLSGVMSKWHQIAPDIVPKSDVPPSEYFVGEHPLVWHAFAPATSLYPPAALWVSYGPPFGTYKRLSYLDILQDKIVPNVKDKIVLIGFSADIDPTSDTYAIPSTPGKACAAEVVAYATQTLLDGRNMRVIPQWFQLLSGSIFIVLVALVAGASKPLHAVVGVLGAIIGYYIAAIFAYRSDWFSDFLVLPATATATSVAAGALNAWQNSRARQRVIDLFGRYVPRAIVNQLVLQPDLQSLMLGGRSREMTVMFADIRGFTDFSQDLTPEEVVRQLNSLLEKMVACTFEFEGTLDKFIGDAILVLFNAPTNQEDHSLRAVRTAIAIQSQLANHPSGLKIGIGIHRGLAVVGNIGTPQRMEYTAIGSTVNIASRLCDQAAPGEIVVSQSVIDNIDESVSLSEQSTVHVKGIKAGLSIARVKATSQAPGA